MSSCQWWEKNKKNITFLSGECDVSCRYWEAQTLTVRRKRQKTNYFDQFDRLVVRSFGIWSCKWQVVQRHLMHLGITVRYWPTYVSYSLYTALKGNPKTKGQYLKFISQTKKWQGLVESLFSFPMASYNCSVKAIQKQIFNGSCLLSSVCF